MEVSVKIEARPAQMQVLADTLPIKYWEVCADHRYRIVIRCNDTECEKTLFSTCKTALDLASACFQTAVPNTLWRRYCERVYELINVMDEL